MWLMDVWKKNNKIRLSNMLYDSPTVVVCVWLYWRKNMSKNKHIRD